MEISSSVVRFGTLTATHVIPADQISRIPIIFIHGAMGGRWQFKNWQGYCAKRGWESYALDLRGHHDSPWDDIGKVKLEDYVNDVEQIIERIGPCYLIGHSMGGLVAQLVAARDPKVGKAVFVASAPPAGILFMNSFLFAMIKYLPKFIFHRPVLLTSKDASRFLLDRLGSGMYGSLVPESGQACADMAFAKPKKIKCPTMVIAARFDHLLPTSAHKRMARKYSSKYIELDMGHMIPLENDWENPIINIVDWLELKDN